MPKTAGNVTSASFAAVPAGTYTATVSAMNAIGSSNSSAVSDLLTVEPAKVTTLTLPARSLKPGTTVLPLSYGGFEGDFAGSSTTVSVNIAKAASTLKVSGPKKFKRGKTATFTVIVRPLRRHQVERSP